MKTEKDYVCPIIYITEMPNFFQARLSTRVLITLRLTQFIKRVFMFYASVRVCVLAGKNKYNWESAVWDEVGKVAVS